MSYIQDIFNSDFFHYVYIFRLGSLYDCGEDHPEDDYRNEVYIVSENPLTEKEIAEKKRIITLNFNQPVIEIRKEQLSNEKVFEDSKS